MISVLVCFLFSHLSLAGRIDFNDLKTLDGYSFLKKLEIYSQVLEKKITPYTNSDGSISYDYLHNAMKMSEYRKKLTNFRYQIIKKRKYYKRWKESRILNKIQELIQELTTSRYLKTQNGYGLFLVAEILELRLLLDSVEENQIALNTENYEDKILKTEKQLKLRKKSLSKIGLSIGLIFLSLVSPLPLLASGVSSLIIGGVIAGYLSAWIYIQTLKPAMKEYQYYLFLKENLERTQLALKESENAIRKMLMDEKVDLKLKEEILNQVEMLISGIDDFLQKGRCEAGFEDLMTNNYFSSGFHYRSLP
tara:strand:- start:288 stop:1208 length:921 start_codon:yes stop_codon:yes gene_type:complete